jgi:hypothetical protein
MDRSEQVARQFMRRPETSEFGALLAEFYELADEAHQCSLVLREFREFIKDVGRLTRRQMGEVRQTLRAPLEIRGGNDGSRIWQTEPARQEISCCGSATWIVANSLRDWRKLNGTLSWDNSMSSVNLH